MAQVRVQRHFLPPQPCTLHPKPHTFMASTRRGVALEAEVPWLK